MQVDQRSNPEGSIQESLHFEKAVDSVLLTSSWNAFGEYIAKNLRASRGVNVPRFGTFTFSAPEVSLNGVTNPQERDKQHRVPVFIVSKEFCKGHGIKSGIYGDFGIRPYTVSWINGPVQEIKANMTEIGVMGHANKDVAQLSVDRFLRLLTERCKNGENCSFVIPQVGELIIRNKIAAVRFYSDLYVDARSMTNRTINKSGKFDGTRSASNWNSMLRATYGGGDRASSPRSNSMVKSVSALKGKTVANNWFRGSVDGNMRPKTAAMNDLSVSNGHVNRTTDGGFQSGRELMARPSSSGGMSMNQSQMTRMRSIISEHDNAFKKLSYWMRGKAFNPEDSFNYICVVNFGARANRYSKFTRDQLAETFKKVELHFTPAEINELFEGIDANRDGYIDIDEWKANVRHEASLLDYIKDVIFRNNLHTDDLLKRMDIDKGQGSLNQEQLAKALRNLESYLSIKKANLLAKMILRGQSSIQVFDLIEFLGSKEDQAVPIDMTWYMTIIKRLGKTQATRELLRSEFEKYDTRNEGSLDIANFKTVLMKSSQKLGVTINEINRLTRYVEKDKKMMIDYVDFLKMLNKTSDDGSGEDLHLKIIGLLCDYGHSQQIPHRELIRRAALATGETFSNNSDPRIKCFKFATWIHDQFLHGTQQDDIYGVVDEFDIDRDGYIDEIDLSTVLNRRQTFEVTKTTMNFAPSLKMTASTLDRRSMTSTGSVSARKGLFPTVPLSEDRIDAVLRDLRRALNDQKISYFEAFRLFDMNDDGFLSVDELSTALDKVIKLSEPVKQGFFAYLDNQRIGMVDYPRFLTVMKKSVYDKNVEVSEDSWEWQNGVIKRMRDWCIHNKMTMEDAFRTIDRDFDGFVNKTDLETFLVEVLHMPPKEITSPQLDRLFKLMDQFKRGLIQLNDFKRSMESELSVAANQTISGGKSFDDQRSTFDWRTNAKQQIGLLLSQRFPTIKASFEDISGHSTRLTYQKFKKWIEDSRALTGFNLTEKLLQQLFSDLDPHKKGHLSENDWENAFGGYAWKGQLSRELEEAIYAYFMDIKSAFRFFASSGGKLDSSQATTKATVDFEKFKLCCGLLLPQRFNSDELAFMWKSLQEMSGSDVTYMRFSLMFNTNNFRGTKRISSPARTIATTVGSSLRSKMSASTGTIQRPATYGTPVIDYNITWQENIVDKIRMMLPSTIKNLDNVFRQYDKPNLGKISEKDFRSAIRNLNLGLSLSEIDQLLNVCELDNEGYVNWKKFCEKLRPREIDTRIIERSRNRLIKLKENVYAFLLSPKDAFRLFNEDRTGKLTFEQFNRFIVKVSQLSHEDIPSFAIVRDLFDTFDIRRDGVVDINEWMQTFRLIEESTYGPNAKANNSNSLNTAAIFSTNTLHLTTWGQTPEYEAILRFVGKNRKILIETFTAMEQKKIPLTFANVKKELAEALLKANLTVPEKNWELLLKFAEKDGLIDYKFMMNVFKERLDIILSHPKEKAH